MTKRKDGAVAIADRKVVPPAPAHAKWQRKQDASFSPHGAIFIPSIVGCEGEYELLRQRAVMEYDEANPYGDFYDLDTEEPEPDGIAAVEALARRVRMDEAGDSATDLRYLKIVCPQARKELTVAAVTRRLRGSHQCAMQRPGAGAAPGE